MLTDRAVTARQILQLLISSVVVYSQSFQKYNHMYAKQLPANLSLHEARTEGECPMICRSSAQDPCYGFRFTKNGKGNGECQIFWDLEEFLSMTPTFTEPSEGGSLIWAVSVVYLGCWRDRSDRDLPSVNYIGPTNSVAVCIQHCSSHGFAYAGLQAGTYCTCGNSYGKHGRRSEADCGMSCPGDSSQICGAGMTNSLYTTYILN